MKYLATLILLVCVSSNTAVAASKPFERSCSTKGFHGKISLHDLGNGTIEVRTKTWRTSHDTIPGRGVFPLLVSGHKQDFYFGRFANSKLPVLIFAVTDPDRITESKVLSYQVTPNGALIGQQVVIDDAIRHGHSDDVVSGRYSLAAIDPSIGAIYTVAYQDAHFEGFFVSYEKLRVRQWDASINSFIESDQGFLREKNGHLVESTKFHQWPDRKREEVFASNLRTLPEYHRRERAVTATPVTAVR